MMHLVLELMNGWYLAWKQSLNWNLICLFEGQLCAQRIAVHPECLDIFSNDAESIYCL